MDSCQDQILAHHDPDPFRSVPVDTAIDAITGIATATLPPLIVIDITMTCVIMFITRIK